MDDHFTHSTLIPIEPTAHRRRPVILTIVIILILGVLATIYWRQLIALPFSSSGSSNQVHQETPPPTLEAKAKLLQSGNDVQAPAAPLSPESKATLLESDNSTESAPAQGLPADEKAKLLRGQ